MALEHRLVIDCDGSLEAIAEAFFECLGPEFVSDVHVLASGRLEANTKLVAATLGVLDPYVAESHEQEYGFRPLFAGTFRAAWDDANEAEEIMIVASIRFIKKMNPRRYGIYRNWEQPFIIFEPGKLTFNGINPDMYSAIMREVGESATFSVVVERWFGV